MADELFDEVHLFFQKCVTGTPAPSTQGKYSNYTGYE